MLPKDLPIYVAYRQSIPAGSEDDWDPTPTALQMLSRSLARRSNWLRIVAWTSLSLVLACLLASVLGKRPDRFGILLLLPFLVFGWARLELRQLAGHRRRDCQDFRVWAGGRTLHCHGFDEALAIAPGAHAVVLMDQAGWHMSGKLAVPGNISIIPLPPKCPELNPVENVWQFMRDDWLSNRVFTSQDNIVDHCCEAPNNLVDQPRRIMTIGRRQWARRL